MATSRITWRDAQLMPADGKRYEAIDGVLCDRRSVAPPPAHHCQPGSRAPRAARRGRHGWVYHAPIGVEFPQTEEGVQPDIIFVARRRAERLVDEGIRGAPDLVVEILSPSSRERDRTIERKLYDRQGVSQYWLVDPETLTVEVWGFAASATEPARHTDRLPVRITIESATVEAGEIDLAGIFEPER